ncbi:MAG: YciI family protein [Pseudomonadota bacterium]
MQYCLMYFEAPTETARRTAPDADSYWANWSRYFEMVRGATDIIEGNPLQPGETKTLVRSGPGGRVVEDGPFADAREELAGYVIVDVPNIDEAIALAEGAPCASDGGHVEIRPVLMRHAAEQPA